MTHPYLRIAAAALGAITAAACVYEAGVVRADVPSDGATQVEQRQ
jgi:hypothetical protein